MPKSRYIAKHGLAHKAYLIVDSYGPEVSLHQPQCGTTAT